MILPESALAMISVRISSFISISSKMPDAVFITGVVAEFAALAAEGVDAVAEGGEFLARRDDAAFADDAHQTLGQHGYQRGADEVVFHAHVGESCDSAGGVVGMERRKNEVAGEGGADGDVGGFAVADFTNHDHVGILAHNMADAGGERQSDLRVDVHLVNAVHLVFHRILDGDDLAAGLVDPLERGIKRRRFTGPGRAGDQHDAVRKRRVVMHAVEHVLVETEFLEVVEVARGAVENTHYQAFAINSGQRRDAQVDIAAQDFNFDAAVLGQAAFRNVELRHQFEPADNSGLEFARRRLLVRQDAIDAITDAEFLLERFDMDVGGTALNCECDHRVDQADDRRFARHVAQVFQVFAGLGKVNITGLAVAVAEVALNSIENFGFAGEMDLDAEL